MREETSGSTHEALMTLRVPVYTFLTECAKTCRNPRYSLTSIKAGPTHAAGATPLRTLLCVCNFPSNTGYAWEFIEGLYAQIADRLAQRGVRTLVAYPKVIEPPRSLAHSTAQAVELGFNLSDGVQRRRITDFIRAENVRALYLTDRPACSPFYPLLRRSGARHITVHDHTSGARTAPKGLKRMIKWLYTRFPGVAADTVIGVSNYVAERNIHIGLVDGRKVICVWNGIPVMPAPLTSVPSATSGGSRPARTLHRAAGIDPDRTVVVCCCRAHAVKGVAHLLPAFDQAWKALHGDSARPALVYIGDGAQLAELTRIRETLSAREDIRFLGYRPDAADLLADADVCVVPSVWQDAFPLGVLEPMALGKPVIATAVGGIPEMVENEVTGLLIPPADEPALAGALLRLLRDPALASRLGSRARARVAERFTPDAQIDALTEILARGFAA
jgi:glycosyltransferase involved in cell wall biosynthesis